MMKLTLITVYSLCVSMEFILSVDGRLVAIDSQYNHNTLQEDAYLECVSHSQCAADRACINHRCVDPCDALCGSNTVCDVTDHVASCECVADHYCTCDMTLGCQKSRHNNSTHFSTTTTTDSVRQLETTTEKPKSPKKKFRLFKDTKVDWQTALAQCYHEDMKLASILNKEENDQLEHLIREIFVGISGDDTYVWLAGADLAVEGAYRWMTTGKRINYTSWLPVEVGFINQPSAESGCDCVGAYIRTSHSFGWFTQECENKCVVVCEYFV